MKTRRLRKIAMVGAALLALVISPRVARAAFFFDANYPDVKWKTFETEHFVFHYYESASPRHPNSTAWTARRAAKYAEIVYPKVCAQFDYYLKEKVHIVVRDQEETSNGFAVYSEDWVTIWATPLYYRFRGRMDWVPDVLAHEFAHIVSLKANENRGIGMTLGSEVGGLEDDGRNNVAWGGAVPLGEGNRPPHWWTEGGAEYWTHNAGYNQWSPARDMLLRMSMLDPDTTLTLEELSAPGSYRGLDGERGYNHGYSIGLYLAETYGDDTFARFARASASRSRWKWEDVMKEVLGITPRQMWEGWVTWNRDRYGRVKDALEKEGMHEGTEASWREPLWLAKEGAKAREWKTYDKRRRRYARERKGQSNDSFRVAPDGQAFGWTERWGGNVNITFLDPDQLPAFTGHWLDAKSASPSGSPEPVASPEMTGWRALSDGEKLERIPTLTLRGLSTEFAGGAAGWSFSPDGSSVVVARPGLRSCWGDYDVSGYDFSDLVVYDLGLAKAQAAQVIAGTRQDIEISCPQERAMSKQITDEARVVQPEWSPDGTWIAFVKVGDGTTNLGKIHPDGSGMSMLTAFREGEQIGQPHWSPDSSQLVFYFYKPASNGQQNLWLINADGTGMRPLSWEKAEEKNPNWTSDGKILFSSDRSGIFNVYRMDPKNGSVTQLTNVLGGAFSGELTREGNLLYTGFNAYGFQNYALKKSDFYDKPIVSTEARVSEKQYDQLLSKSEELPELPRARRYSAFKDLEPPVVVPIMRYEGGNVQGGGELVWWDYAGKHAFISDVLLGQNQDYVVRYLNDMWYPELSLIFARFDRSSELTVEVSPGSFAERNVRSQVDFWLLNSRWQLGGNAEANVGATMRSFDRIEGNAGNGVLHTDGPWDFGTHGIGSTAELNASFHHFTIAPGTNRGTFNINPRGSREFTVSVGEAFTRLPHGQVEDGTALQSYPFTRIDLSAVGYVAAPWLEYHEHTIQLGAQAGYLDRNVQFNDEYFAGGEHPWARFNQVSPNTAFAGYPAFSINGETELLASAAYRFPLYRDLNKKAGPIYVDNAFFQFFATAGNIWSFRARPGGGSARELPLVGLVSRRAVRDMESNPEPTVFEKAFPVAEKNGNRLLTDAGAELRVRAWIYNDSPWFSFVRAAYGFQDITGAGDVNGDQIIGINERTRHGFRWTVGLGTGW